MLNLNFDWIPSDDEEDDEWDVGNRSLKILLIGRRRSGKSALLRAFNHNAFDASFAPSEFAMDNCSVAAFVDDKLQIITLWDTSSDRRLNALVLHGVALALLCLPCGGESERNDEATIESMSRFVSEFRQCCPHTPILLVGTKSDLARSSVARRETIACRLGVQSYKECSALTDAGVGEMLVESLRILTDARGFDRLAIMRNRATEICIALDALGLPALVTLTVLDAALDNNVRMAAKWSLVTAVKHFRDKDREAPPAAEHVYVKVLRGRLRESGPEDSIEVEL
jgi:GTPase SAR1 family protein